MAFILHLDICHKCVCSLKNINRRGSEQSIKNGVALEQNTAKMWTSCDENVPVEHCSVCKHYDTFSGGRRFTRLRTIKANTTGSHQASCAMNTIHDTQTIMTDTNTDSSDVSEHENSDPSHPLQTPLDQSSISSTPNSNTQSISSGFNDTTNEDSYDALMHLALAIAGGENESNKVPNNTDHSTVATIEIRTKGIRQEGKRMSFIIESSLLQTVPELKGVLRA